MIFSTVVNRLRGAGCHRMAETFFRNMVAKWLRPGGCRHILELCPKGWANKAREKVSKVLISSASVVFLSFIRGRAPREFSNFSVSFEICPWCLSQIPNPTSPQRDVCYRMRSIVVFQITTSDLSL